VTRAAVCRVLAMAFALLAPALAPAQEFGVYLACKGAVQAKGKSLPAHLDLALRRNNGSALIQRSDVLPVGERLKFDTSPTHYSMVLRSPVRGTLVHSNWLHGTLFIWDPDMHRLQTTRLSVDRQTAVLEGELLDKQGEQLGRVRMQCEPSNNDTVPEPKF
jgi:hypothetical protein